MAHFIIFFPPLIVMSIGLYKEDIDAVRSYVTAKDGHEYDYVEDGIVCFDVTHNYLKVRMHDIRMPLSSTVLFRPIPHK